MYILVREPLAMRAWCDEDDLWVELDDGRKIGVPLAYFPRLLHASSAQRNVLEMVGCGQSLRWPEIDEDISIESLVLGVGDQTVLEMRRNLRPTGEE